MGTRGSLVRGRPLVVRLADQALSLVARSGHSGAQRPWVQWDWASWTSSRTSLCGTSRPHPEPLSPLLRLFGGLDMLQRSDGPVHVRLVQDELPGGHIDLRDLKVLLDLRDRATKVILSHHLHEIRNAFRISLAPLAYIVGLLLVERLRLGQDIREHENLPNEVLVRFNEADVADRGFLGEGFEGGGAGDKNE